MCCVLKVVLIVKVDGCTEGLGERCITNVYFCVFLDIQMCRYYSPWYCGSSCSVVCRVFKLYWSGKCARLTIGYRNIIYVWKIRSVGDWPGRSVPSPAGDTYSWKYFMENEMLHFLFVVLWNLFRFFPACKPRSVYCFRCYYPNTFLKNDIGKVTVIRIITKNTFSLRRKTDKKKEPDEWWALHKKGEKKNIHSFNFSLGLTKEKSGKRSEQQGLAGL